MNGEMKRKLSTLGMLLMGILAFTQSPYELCWKTEGLLVGSASLMAGVSLVLNTHLIPLTIEEVEGLNAQDINWFDRSATRQFSSKANRRSDFGEIVPIALGAVSSFVLPAISSNSASYWQEMGTLLVMWGEVNLVSATGTHLLKSGTKRTRPFVYNPKAGLEAKLSVSARKSFISGHTTASAANMFFLATLFSDYFPESKLKPYVWGLAAAIPAWTGFERYLAGKHFPTDIISGYVFGAICGYFIPQMHKPKMSKKGMNLAFYPYANFNQNGLEMVLKF